MITVSRVKTTASTDCIEVQKNSGQILIKTWQPVLPMNVSVCSYNPEDEEATYEASREKKEEGRR
jgi:hypothetical protein